MLRLLACSLVKGLLERIDAFERQLRASELMEFTLRSLSPRALKATRDHFILYVAACHVEPQLNASGCLLFVLQCS